MEPIKKGQGVKAAKEVKINFDVRQFQFSSDGSVGVFRTVSEIHILDVKFMVVRCTLRLKSPPRFMTLTPNGILLYVCLTDATILVYQTLNGSCVTNLSTLLTSPSRFAVSSNSARLLCYGTSSILLWDAVQRKTILNSPQWRNVYCEALNANGSQFALGMFNGTILIISVVSQSRCTEMEIKRDTSCVLAVAFHKNGLVAANHNGIFLRIQFQKKAGQTFVSYETSKLNEAPRSLLCFQDKVFFRFMNSFSWLVGKNLMKMMDGLYGVCRFRKEICVLKYVKGKLEWWPIRMFE